MRTRIQDTPQFRAEFRALYLEGRSYREICAHFGWADEKHAGHWKQKLELPSRHRGPRPEQIEAVVAMVGRRIAHIARDLRMQPSTVMRILVERGLYDVRRREEPAGSDDHWRKADARWRSVAGDLRYEDARVPATMASRWDQRRAPVRSEVGCAAGMCAP